MRETIPDLSRCVILSLRSEIFPQLEPDAGYGLFEIFTLDYLNPMGFYETHSWTEER